MPWGAALAGTVSRMNNRPTNLWDRIWPAALLVVVAVVTAATVHQYAGAVQGSAFYGQYLRAAGHAPPAELEEQAREAAARSGPGLRVGIDGNLAKQCSAGFPLSVDGSEVTVTAGHCLEGARGEGQDPVPNVFGAHGHRAAPHAVTLSGDGGAVTYDDGYGADIGITSRSGGRPPFPAQQVGSPATGDAVCIFGTTTGWACGVVEGEDLGGWSAPVRLWRTTIIAARGDSGAVVYRDGTAVGVLSYITGPKGSDEVTGSLVTDLGEAVDVISRNGHRVAVPGD